MQRLYTIASVTFCHDIIFCLLGHSDMLSYLLFFNSVCMKYMCSKHSVTIVHTNVGELPWVKKTPIKAVALPNTNAAQYKIDIYKLRNEAPSHI